MIAPTFHHIAHTASAISTVLHLPERGRSAAPVLLNLAGFTPVQAEVLIGGFLVTLQAANIAFARLKSHLPNHTMSRQSAIATRH